MRKYITSILNIVAVMSLAAMAVSCNKESAGDAGTFSKWISACTGEQIYSNSTVKVQFTAPVGKTENGMEAVADIISFTPAIEGTARWSDDGATLEFIPEEGALKSGGKYTATVRLDKLTGEQKSPKFRFGFHVAKKVARIEFDRTIIPADNAASSIVCGHITFSEAPDPDTVTPDIVRYDKIKEGTVEIAPGDNPARYDFTISGIERVDSDRYFSVSLDTDGTGFKTNSSCEAVIPGTSSFLVMDAIRHDEADPYIELQFSQPVDGTRDLGGLLGIDGVGKAYYEYSDNIVRIYYESTGSKDVTVTAYSGIRSIGGMVLAENFTETFKNGSIKPEVRININGSILPDTDNLILPFQAVNLAAVDVSVIKIYENNVLSFLQENSLGGSSELRRNGRLIYKKTARLDTDTEKNLHEWNDFSIDLSGLFKKDANAIYRIKLSFRKEYSLYGTEDGFAPELLTEVSDGEPSDEDNAVWDTPYGWYSDWTDYIWEEKDDPTKDSYYLYSSRFPSYNVMASDIGLIVKSNDDGKLWITASDIISASPMGGVEIKAYNYQLQEIGKARTGSDGFAEIEPSGKTFIVTASSGGKTTYMEIGEYGNNSMSSFDTGGAVVTKGIKGFVYGERGVWRPGDTVHLVLVVEGRDKEIPENHPVTMELYSPLGQFYDKQVNMEGKDGFYRFDIKTSEDDPTGTWNAYFKIGGATFHKSVMIETVKPNRLKINFKPEDDILIAGKATNFSLSSIWLTGPAASGLRATAEMTLTTNRSSFKGWEGYTFINPASNFSRSEKTIIDGRLSQEGLMTGNVTMPQAENAPGMLNAAIVCTVLEEGGDASYYSETRLFSPFSSYVGIKLGDNNFETDTDLAFKVVNVDQEGRKVSGHRLEYRIWKLDWSWWWDMDADNIASFVNNTGAEVAASETITCTGGEASIPFRINYPEWGRFLIYVKDLESGHATGGIVLIDWPAWRGRSDRDDSRSVNTITLSTDKEEYEVGETATLYIPSSQRGRAMISFENGSEVIARDWVKAKAGEDTQYKFRITPEMAPNFYIHVTMVRPHGNAPIRLYGVQPVMVTNKKSHLEPVIEMPDVIRPQEPFTLKIKEKSGKPMTCTIAIVDEGLLDLTSFKTPDPWNTIYAREALGIKTWDIYDHIIGAYGSSLRPVLGIGGDESIDKGAKKDNRFNPVVEFIGPVTIGKKGESQKITLPMYVGSVRVMVVAGADGAFGNAEKTVPVRAPLMILPTLPAAVGCGEDVTMPVNVFAMENSVKDVNVTVSIDGPLAAASGSKHLTFTGTGDKIADFSLRGGQEEGTAKVTVKAVGGGFSASETINIEVRNTNARRIERRTASIDAGKEATVKWNPFVAGAGDYAILELASLPTIDFNGAFEYMKSYPYSCTEQLSSKALTYLYAKAHLNEANAKAADMEIPAVLQQIYSRQNSDGGFCYWPGSKYSDEWVSSMAGQALVEAQSQGYNVSKSVLASWKNFQKKCVRNYHNQVKKNLGDLQQAYRLYTLALAGEPDAGAMNRLRESQSLSAQASWCLAAAYSIAGKKNVSKEIIEKIGNNAAEAPEDRWETYWSSLRDKAMTLEALVLAGYDADAISYARKVADEYNSAFGGTQETAFASIAMGRMASQFNKGALIADVRQSAVQEVKSTETVKTVNLDSAKGEVTVSNKSDGTIHATLVTCSKPAMGEAVKASAEGLSLKVAYTDNNGKSINPATLRQGTEFDAVITVTGTSAVQEVRNIALVFNAVTGWEIQNQRLLGTEQSEPCTYKDIRDSRVVWYFDLPSKGKKTFTVRCRAAYEGKFVLPATTCEAMYDTAFHASTANATVSVTK